MDLSFLEGGGEMGARMRALDWSRTALGAPQHWPQSLRTAVSLCLHCRFPIILFWGPRLTHLYNDAYRPILGTKHPAALGSDAVAVWPEILDILLPMLNGVMDSGEATWSRDLLLPLARGEAGETEDCYFSFSYSPVVLENGRVGGVFCPVIETTETVKAQRGLEDEKGRLKDLFENAPTFMAVLEGPEHVFSLVNANYQQAFGPRELIGRTVREGFPELEGQPYFDAMDRAYRSGRAVSLLDTQARLRWPGEERDEERYMDVVYQPTRNADGSVRGLFVQGVDITARKRADRRDAFLVRLDDAIRTLADADEIAQRMMQLLCEELAADRTNYFEVGTAAAIATVISDHSPGIVSLDGRSYTIDDFGTTFASAMRAGRPLVLDSVEDAALTPAERARYDENQIGALVIFPLHKQDQLIAMVGVYQGTARRWRAEEVDLVHAVVNRCWEAVGRARTERKLRDADRRKDEFLATLAHELRNPLAPLRNSLAVLGHDSPKVPRERLYAMMGRQVDHLVRLVDDLLDVSRITQGKIHVSHDLVDLSKVVGMAVDSVRDSLDAAGHQLDLVLPAAVVTVRGDSVRLTQVVANLLNNAVRYTPTGGRIGVELRSDGQQAQVCVSDNGVGIDRSVQARVFELFAQGSEPRPGNGGGLGIGLYLVERIARLHGGRVSVHSAGAGQGATFTVTLPCAAAGSLTNADPVRVATHFEGMRVLVVDDNRDAADSIKLLLAELGCVVTVAYEGAGALATLRAQTLPQRPEIAFLDLGMPSMDGHALAQAIRSLAGGRDIALVALSGWGLDRDRLATRRSGFDEHLIKPASVQAIEQVLRRARRSAA
jgi:PAS domain S-box-containing protein